VVQRRLHAQGVREQNINSHTTEAIHIPCTVYAEQFIDWNRSPWGRISTQSHIGTITGTWPTVARTM